MNQPPDPASSLRELQREFARALQSQPGSADVFVAAGEPTAASGLDVYRNNGRQFFRSALELTFAVVRRRVGDDYFRQLAERYRAAHPSRRGDLHWVGEHFPAWLDLELAGTEYAWLSDLAQLEWLCEESMASRRDAALPLQALAGLPAVELGGLRLALQPSLRLMSSPYPVWSVWHANQGDADAEPVDFSLGTEHCAIACLEDRVTVYRLATGDYRLLVAIREGATLGDAMETAGVDAQKLGALLGWAFSEQLVVALEPSPTA